MIEALKSDAIVDKVGGRFKLCALIQRRLVQLMDGARPLVDRAGRSDLEVVVEEILRDKITLEIPSNHAAELGPIPDHVKIGPPSANALPSA
jgi:DNA-directed RNA polymerase subunit omega